MGRQPTEECAAASAPPRQWPPDRHADFLHTRLDLQVDPRTRTLAGVATHRLVPIAKPLRRLALDLCELTVDAVSLGGRKLAFRHQEGTLDIFFKPALPAGREVDVDIAYHGSPRTGLNFTGPEPGYPDRPYQAWSQSQHEYARHWFPCHDFPHQKQTTELIVEAPAQFETVSNGRLVSVEQRGESRRWHWREDVPHATYLVSLVVGTFETWEDEVDGVPLHYHVPPGRRDDGHRCFDETPAMIRIFAEMTGTPYPFEKYASVVVQDFIWGGMENTSATTFSERILAARAAMPDHEPAGLVSHELAHQWFGDLITCRDWSHGWLNEGFATFAWPYYAERAYGLDDSERLYLEHAAGFIGAERSSRRPTVSNEYSEAADLFDSRIYDKGAWVLRMLRHQLGDDTFFAAVREYFRRHAGGLVVTEDLVRAFEDTSGKSLGWFFDQWVFGAGFPEFEVRHHWDESQGQATIRVRQKQQLDELTRVFRAPLVVDFGLRGGRATKRQVEVGTRGPEESFSFKLPEQPRWVRFDTGNQVLKTLDFDRSEEMLLAQLRHDEMTGRVEAVEGLGGKATPGATRALARTVAEDPYWYVQGAAALALGRIQSAAARQALLGSLTHSDSRVRTSVAGALGSFGRDHEIAAALTRTIAKDNSRYVVSAAASALGRTGSAGAIPTLATASRRPAHPDTTRDGALRGLAALRHHDALAPILTAAGPGTPPRVRATALVCGAQLARTTGRADREEVARVAVGLLRDPLYFVRRGAVACLSTLGDSSAIPAITDVLTSDLEAGVRSEARAAIAHLSQASVDEQEIAGLRSEVEALRGESRALNERLDRLERRC